MARRTGWLIVLLLVACNRHEADTSVMSAPPPPTLPQLQVETAFANLTFSSPVFVTNAGDQSNRLFVVQQGGQILVFPNDPAVKSTTTFLDIAALPQTQFVSGGELGLLGLAFDPNYANNGFFYVNYTINNTNANSQDFPFRTRISRFHVSADPNQADAASESVLLEFDQPFPNHKGGMLAFSPNDHKLYIATGDGGSGDDPQGNAQNLGVPLGKILRINTDGSIPNDNPFVGQSGARGEIWAYGLRNPFRMSFDRATGRQWAGDVGQVSREEVDIIVKGGNYGWVVYEGTLSHINPTNRPASDFIAPVLDYDRTVGSTVIGGYVYRGPGLPDYGGIYIYADFGSGHIWGLVHDQITGAFVSNAEVANFGSITSFGEDEAGELYFVSFADGQVHRFRQM